MKYVLLDTNFILSCIRKKIDFIDQTKMLGLKIVVPLEVKKELDKLIEQSMKKTQGEAKIALTILRKTQFQEVELKTKNVDNGIVEFANKNKDYVIATLDKEIQEKIKNYKLIIRGEKGIELSN